MVITVEFSDNVDLSTVFKKLDDVEYEPEQFPGLVYRMKKPKVAFLLFGSGKIVCTGARNKKQIEEAIKYLIKKLKKIGAFK